MIVGILKEVRLTMKVGILKEIKVMEERVCMVATGVATMIANGHQVIAEKSGRSKSMFSR